MYNKVLSEKSRNRRIRISNVNIQVTFIVWLVEFLGCLTMAIDFLVVGSRSNAITGLLRTLTMFCYFVLLPWTYLMNSSETKHTIADESWRVGLAGIFMSSKERDASKGRLPLSKELHPPAASTASKKKASSVLPKEDVNAHRNPVKGKQNEQRRVNHHRLNAWTTEPQGERVSTASAMEQN